MTTYTREENTILADGEKVAVIAVNGLLKMSKGMTEHREGVEAFLAADEEKGPTTEIPAEAPKKDRQPDEKRTDNPICPVPEDKMLGDKTPGVIAWWFGNHPEAAAKKYAGRKFQMPTL